MIVYFSRSKKTEIFAKTLADMINMPIFELRSDLGQLPTHRFVLRLLRLFMGFGKCSVIELPKALPGRIFVCSPVWAGGFALPVRHFLQNANLTDVEVNVLLTAAAPTESHARKAEAFLHRTPCKIGKVHIFATSSGAMPEVHTIRAHMKELM